MIVLINRTSAVRTNPVIIADASVTHPAINAANRMSI
jgi:hypothetical protein